MLNHKLDVTIVKPVLELNSSAIAEVVQVENGNPKQVLWKQQILDVAMVSPSIFGYKVGCSVLIQNVEHQIVVVQLISTQVKDHPVLYRDKDSWVLTSDEDFDLKVGKSLLRVTSQGHISLHGEDITTNAEGLNRILGSRIELN